MNLFYPWDDRAAGPSTFDTTFKNLIAEPIGDGEYYQLIKRDGAEQFPLSAPVNGLIMGTYYWLTPSNVDYLIVLSCRATGQGEITFYDLSGTSVFSATLAGGNVYKGDDQAIWSEFLYQNGNVDLLFTIGGRLFRATNGPPALPGNPIVTSATGTFGITYMDGYAFVNDGTAVWNSALNDPTTWPASGFIAADAYGDTIIRMGRTGPYIFAMGKDSVQYFYDAGNPTGSPLSPNTGATQKIGYVAGYAPFGDDIYFIGTQNGNNPSLCKMTGLNITQLTSPQFTRWWTQRGSQFSVYTLPPEGAIIELAGHSCYYVRTWASQFPVGSAPVNIGGSSYIYDLQSKQWSQLGFGSTETFLIGSATQVPNQSGQISMTFFSVLGSGEMRRFNPTYYRDDVSDIECLFRTRPLDFGTYRIKFCSRVMIQADNSTAPTFCNLRWSDDDYISTGGLFGLGRQIPLNQQLKQAWALGNFRARSWELRFSGPYAMRFRALEIEYNLGQA